MVCISALQAVICSIDKTQSKRTSGTVHHFCKVAFILVRLSPTFDTPCRCFLLTDRQFGLLTSVFILNSDTEVVVGDIRFQCIAGSTLLEGFQLADPGLLAFPIPHKPAAADELFNCPGMIRNGFKALAGLRVSVQPNQAVGQGHVQIDAGFMVFDAALQDSQRFVKPSQMLVHEAQPPEGAVIRMVVQ